jgi:hypothetical protein
MADEAILILPFKGPLLAQQAYGNLGLRVFQDLDLLIHPADAARGLELLASMGYRPNPRLAWVTPRSWTRWSTETVLRKHETYIDLHWRLLRDHYPIRLDPELVWGSAITVEYGGLDVRSISPEVLLQVLAVHGGKHCWGHLSLVADIAWLLDASPGFDWPALVEAAGESGCRRALLLALALLKDIYQTELPSTVGDAIAQDPKLQVLRAKVWKRLTESPLPAPDTREFSFAAALSERRTRTVGHWLGLLFNPTEAEWKSVRLPAALFFMYVPFRLCRLLHKYFRRT